MPGKQKELARGATNKRANCKSSKENMTGKGVEGKPEGPHQPAAGSSANDFSRGSLQLYGAGARADGRCPEPGEKTAGRKETGFPKLQTTAHERGRRRESSIQMEHEQLCHSPLQERDGQMKDELTSASPVRCF